MESDQKLNIPEELIQPLNSLADRVVADPDKAMERIDEKFQSMIDEGHFPTEFFMYRVVFLIAVFHHLNRLDAAQVLFSMGGVDQIMMAGFMEMMVAQIEEEAASLAEEPSLDVQASSPMLKLGEPIFKEPTDD